MTTTVKSTVTSVVFAIALGSGSAVFAKAHDQGVADGESTPDNTGMFLQTLDNGVSGIVKEGAQGAAASDPDLGRSNLRTEPVVGNGNNAD